MLRRISTSLLGEAKYSSGDEQVDVLLKECDVLIKDLQQLAPQESSIFTPLKDILSQTSDMLTRRNQKSKRITQTSSDLYRELSPKVQHIESSLRGKLAQITERKSALIDQALHLRERVNACILYNVSELQSYDMFISECKDILAKLKAEYSLVNDMKRFNFEVTRQAAQAANRGKSFSAWAYVMRSMKPRSESEEIDEEQVFLFSRLQAIDTCVSDFEVLLAFAIETQKVHSKHLEQCNFVRKDLAEGTKSTESSTSSSRDSPSASRQSSFDNGRPPVFDDLSSYDHRFTKYEHILFNLLCQKQIHLHLNHRSNCHDCAYTYGIAVDCSTGLAMLDKQEENISQRLLTLIDLREMLRGYLEKHSLLHTNDSSVFFSTLPISIPSSSEGEVMVMSQKQLQRDIERDSLIINGVKIGGSVGLDEVIAEIGRAIDAVFSSSQLPPLPADIKNEFSLSSLRKAARTNSGGQSFQALQSLVNVADITIIPLSSLASPLEIDIKISPCGKLITDAKNDIEMDSNSTESLGLVAKINTATVYLLKKSGTSMDEPTPEPEEEMGRSSLASNPAEDLDTPPPVDASCDLTAIYENQVFVVLSKDYVTCVSSVENAGATQKRRSSLSSWFGGSSNSSSSSPSPSKSPLSALTVQIGTGSVLIDSRR